MATTDEYLYVTTNTAKVGSSHTSGSLVWRMPLADFADNSCNVRFTYSTEPSYVSFALAQGAGSTMYWLAHAGAAKNSLRITYISDSSSSTSSKTKSIFSYPDPDGDSCKAPDGNNPCGRSDDRITAAWVAGGVLGAM